MCELACKKERANFGVSRALVTSVGFPTEQTFQAGFWMNCFLQNLESDRSTVKMRSLCVESPDNRRTLALVDSAGFGHLNANPNPDIAP